MRLAGQVALVTGGSRGFGAAICRALAADGASVVVNYRSREDAAKQVVADIEAIGGRAFAIQGDVARHEEVDSMVRQATEEYGALHILVNNAGITDATLLHAAEPDAWLEVMRTNFGGVFNGTRAVLPLFMAAGAGVIVNVSSVLGERAWIGASSYSASKGAVDAFTRSTALEAARFGIRVNAVLPGFSPTDMAAEVVDGDAGRAIKKQIPMRSFAEAEQVAQVVRFLAGPESAYLTGALVPVDGGAMATLGLGRAR